jgi:anaerobic ribonucleoside-triphosphate reductase
MTKDVVKKIEEETPEGKIPTVEGVQDIVEKVLMASKLPEVAKAYILYREERSKVRDRESRLMKTFQEIEHDKKTTSNFLLKRGDFHFENPTKSIMSYGREGAKEYNKMFTISSDYVKMHEDGDIFIKEIEYYASSFNTLQINF